MGVAHYLHYKADLQKVHRANLVGQRTPNKQQNAAKQHITLGYLPEARQQSCKTQQAVYNLYKPSKQARAIVFVNLAAKYSRRNKDSRGNKDCRKDKDDRGNEDSKGNKSGRGNKNGRGNMIVRGSKDGRLSRKTWKRDQEMERARQRQQGK